MGSSFESRIIGNVGKPPEMKYTDAGLAICKFSVAHNKTRGKGENKVKETVWVRVTTFGNLAELCNQYVKGGDPIAVNGEIDPPRTYERDGETHVSGLEMIGYSVVFLGSGGKQAEQEDSDDIPF